MAWWGTGAIEDAADGRAHLMTADTSAVRTGDSLRGPGGPSAELLEARRVGAQAPQPIRYVGDQRRSVAVPLGGIGTGHVSIAGDGSLRQWQLGNTINHRGHVP